MNSSPRLNFFDTRVFRTLNHSTRYALVSLVALLVCFVSSKLQGQQAYPLKAKPTVTTSANSAGKNVAAVKGTYLVKLKSGAKYAGRIEFENKTRLIITRRNGRIARIDKSDIDEQKRVEEGFSAKTHHQLRVKLQKEFGSKYEVSLTRHFVVVHPPGDYQKWAMPFEELFERFKNLSFRLSRLCSELVASLIAWSMKKALE